MKKLTLIVTLLALAASACLGSDAGTPAPTAPATATAAQTATTPSWETREASEEVARELPTLKSRIADLEGAVAKARSRGNGGAVTRLSRELVSLRVEVAQIKGQPFGGFSNQKKASECLQGMGYRTHGQLISELDGRYVSVEEYEAIKAASGQNSPSSAGATTTIVVVPAPAGNTTTRSSNGSNSGKKGGTGMSPLSLIGWTLACVPALAIVGALLYLAVGNWARFRQTIDDLVETGTGSGHRYDVRGDYGPFRVRYRE